MAKKVYIGVGHGGSDPGAVAYGRKEKDLALDIALACKNELVRNGVFVKISRETDSSVWLEDRIAECNKYNPDAAVDIHLNAGGGDGAEVFHSKADKSDDALAQNILNEIVAIGQNSRGLKTNLLDNSRDYFGFIRQIKCKSALVECAFMDNATDVQIVDTLAERKAMGVAIAKGILKTLGVAYKKPATTTTNTKKKSIDEIAKEVLNGKWGNGEDRKKKLKAAGYDYNKVQAKVNELVTKSTIKIGSTVRLNKGAKTYDGKKLSSFVYGRKHKVKELKGDRAVITYLGITVCAINVKNLTLA